MIKSEGGGKFRVYDSTGKRALSKHPKSREAALAQLRAVEWSKHERAKKPGGK